MFRRTLCTLAALTATALAAPLAFAQAKDIKIAHIYSRTGPLEAYGKQTQTGLMWSTPPTAP
jgi:branched-chain amino acid transport system substrate-binding protein